MEEQNVKPLEPATQDYVEQSEQHENAADGEATKNELPSPPVEVQLDHNPDPNVGVQLVHVTDEDPEEHVGEPVKDPWEADENWATAPDKSSE